MAEIVVRRGLQFVAVILGVITALFFLLRVSGDPVLVLLGPDGVTNPHVVADLRHRMRLDDPLFVQYAAYMVNMLSLDFGESIFQHRSALAIALERIPASLILATLSITVALVLGILLGVAAAMSKSRLLQVVLATIAVIGQSVPVFFVGLVLLLVFSATLKWVPAFGFVEPRSLILPVATLALLPMARFARIGRAAMLEVMQEDYILTARAKGLPTRVVVLRHCLRNMLIPIATLAGYDLIQLFGTATVAEVVFAWPGIGNMLVTSASQRDYPLVQAITFIVAASAVVVSLTVDVLYRVLDPRLRAVPT